MLVAFVLGVGFVAVKFLIPLYTVLDKAGPGSAPRDLALQDDSRVKAPFVSANPVLVEEQPSSAEYIKFAESGYINMYSFFH